MTPHRPKVYSGKKSSDSREKSYYDIYKVEYRVQNDRRNAAARLHVTKRENYDVVEIVTALKIVSLWRDAKHNKACKCHMLADFRNPEHRMLVSAIMSQTNTICDELHFTAESNGIIRAGASEGSYRATGEGYNYYYIFDSKAAAITELLSQISGNMAISGANLINLACVPDDCLLELGFEQVSDMLGVSADMWLGSPGDLIRSSKDDYASHRVIKQNCESFLKIIERYL